MSRGLAERDAAVVWHPYTQHGAAAPRDRPIANRAVELARRGDDANDRAVHLIELCPRTCLERLTPMRERAGMAIDVEVAVEDGAAAKMRHGITARHLHSR